MADGAVAGFANDRFASARAAFEDNLASGADVGASFCATLEGETVVDLWGGGRRRRQEPTLGEGHYRQRLFDDQDDDGALRPHSG